MTEERSPASMEEQTCALVSDSATPPLLSSQESAVSDALGEEHIAGFAPPTLQQQAAINELQDVNDEKIFAWLALVRSLEHGFRYREAAGSLSCQQVNALSTLRDCSNSNIVIWLQCVALSSELWLLCLATPFHAYLTVQVTSTLTVSVARPPNPLPAPCQSATVVLQLGPPQGRPPAPLLRLRTIQQPAIALQGAPQAMLALYQIYLKLLLKVRASGIRTGVLNAANISIAVMGGKGT